MKKIGLAVAALVLLGGSFFAGWQMRARAESNQKEAVIVAAGDYIEALIKGDNEKAYSLGSKGLKKDYNQQKFNELYKGTQLASPKYEWTNAASFEDTYIVYSSVDGYPKNEQGQTKALFAITMVKEDGDWKVDSGIVQ
jgi:hypothetical protein